MPSSKTDGDQPLHRVPIRPPLGLVPSPKSDDDALPESLRLSESVRKGLDLVQLGTTVTEAARQVNLAPSTLHNAANSALGKAYMALQYQALETWMKGLLVQAASVFATELTNPAAGTRLRAAEAIFKNLGGLLGFGGEEGQGKADATDVARKLLERAGIKIEVNVSGSKEPEVKLIGGSKG